MSTTKKSQREMQIGLDMGYVINMFELYALQRTFAFARHEGYAVIVLL